MTLQNIPKYVIFKYAINKKHVITIITNPQNNKKHVIFKYAISKKHVIFKYAISKKHVITIIFMIS